MKRQTFLLAMLALSICSSPALANDQEKVKASLKTWQQLRDKHQGNYSYTVRWSSFAGFGNETKIVVRDNQVAERRFRSFSNRRLPVQPGQPAAKPEGKSWSETGKALGTHKEGAPPKTLDELYAEAAQILKRQLPQHERRYVRFDKQGLLLSCFTVDTRIADDAPTQGVRITSIKLGAADDTKDDDNKATDGTKAAGNTKDKPAKKIYKSPSGKPYPAHWGAPPRIQTRDLRPLPGGYGRGSSTLAKWIQSNLDRDAKAEKKKEYLEGKTPRSTMPLSKPEVGHNKPYAVPEPISVVAF